MIYRTALFLFYFGLMAGFAAAILQPVPGYMDAEYYFSGGQQLYRGLGFQEPFIWNFLADPGGLPVPSHAYWMPLASILTAIGMWASDAGSFWAGKIPFLLIGAFVAPLTAALALRLNPGRRVVWFAGLLAVFPGFYLAYLPTSDTFGIYMLLGGLFLLVSGARPPSSRSFWGKIWPGFQPFLIGSMAAGMHLARADGVLWLFLGLVWALLPRSRQRRRPGARWREAAWVLAGYLVWMGPWLARNLIIFDAPLAPGGFHMLWLREYDELYAYPAALLTPTRWWASGLGAILAARWQALLVNFQTAIAVQGSIFLTPFILAGLWRLRSRIEVRLGVGAWALTFAAMTLMFPFAGSRGGFFHSGAAFQPLFWAAIPAGLDVFLEWGERKRGWQPEKARPRFQILFLAVTALLTVWLVASRLGVAGEAVSWDAGARRYQRVEQALQKAGAQAGELVLVNNPPGYYLAAERPGVVIPFGDTHMVLEVARRYQVRYLLLEIDQIRDAPDLFTHPQDRPGFDYLLTEADVRIYQLQP
jgi:hypothetical protein